MQKPRTFSTNFMKFNSIGVTIAQVGDDLIKDDECEIYCSHYYYLIFVLVSLPQSELVYFTWRLKMRNSS